MLCVNEVIWCLTVLIREFGAFVGCCPGVASSSVARGVVCRLSLLFGCEDVQFIDNFLDDYGDNYRRCRRGKPCS